MTRPHDKPYGTRNEEFGVTKMKNPAPPRPAECTSRGGRIPHAARQKGYSAVEYTVCIVVLAASLIGTSVYLVRALWGRWRDAVDTVGYGRQYEPGVTTVSP